MKIYDKIEFANKYRKISRMSIFFFDFMCLKWYYLRPKEKG